MPIRDQGPRFEPDNSHLHKTIEFQKSELRDLRQVYQISLEIADALPDQVKVDAIVGHYKHFLQNSEFPNTRDVLMRFLKLPPR